VLGLLRWLFKILHGEQNISLLVTHDDALIDVAIKNGAIGGELKLQT
jgi:hypothetical protein